MGSRVARFRKLSQDKVKVYLVMELCTGGELFDRIIELGHFTEASPHASFRVNGFARVL